MSRKKIRKKSGLKKSVKNVHSKYGMFLSMFIPFLPNHKNGPHKSLVIFSWHKEDGFLVFNHTHILPQDNLFLKFVRYPITLWFEQTALE